MSLTPQFLDEIRARTTLSAVIGRSIKIEKAGREYKACCPFHGEKTPSFTINDEKAFFHCHGCHAHGDAIDWLTRMSGLTFIEAVRELAEAVGMTLPDRSPEAAAKAQRVSGLRPVLEAAQGLYFSELDKAADVRAYLHGRGVNDDLIAAFGIGFAPKAGCLRGHNFSQRAMLDAGLIGRNEADGAAGRQSSATYERFRGRVMIPVHDARGRIVGFGGRIFGDAPKSTGKYVNSPGSEIFDKGRTLFNLHRARDAVIAAKRVLVVEGYMDVVALASAGICEATAPMGTAITPEQLGLLWRLNQRPILLFDGDAAGQKAAARACATAMPMIGPARELAIAILPTGVDPDDLVQAGGRDAIENVIAMAQPLHRFLFDAIAQAVTSEAPEAVAAIWDQLEVFAQSIGHSETSTQYLLAWRARFEREICQTVRPSAEGPLPTVRAYVWSDDGNYVWPESASDSERKLIMAAQWLLDWNREHAERKERKKDMLSMVKAMGFSTKALNAAVRDIEADSETREDHEMQWSLYRRVLGVKGPMEEAIMPSLIDARSSSRRLTSAAVKRNAMVDAMLEGGV